MRKKAKPEPRLSVAEYLTRPYVRAVTPEDDGSFRAEIQEFPGCLAVGETAAEALQSLMEVAESWIEAMLDSGQAIPAPFSADEYSGKTVLRMSKSLHKKAAQAAQRDDVSLNQYIVNCIAENVGASRAMGGPWQVSVTQMVGVSSYSNFRVPSLYVNQHITGAPGMPAVPMLLNAEKYWEQHADG